MNTRPAIEGPATRTALSVAFNNDTSCFVVGLTSGYAVFGSANCAKKAVSDMKGGIGIAAMRGSSNIIGLVGGGQPARWAPNKLMLWDAQANKFSLEISTLQPIRGVQISMERIVAVLKNSVRVYKFGKKPELINNYETADNLLGLVDFSSSGELLAFPGRTPGQVQLVNCTNDTVRIVPAHSSPLAAIRFSPDGKLVATASDKGTLIRVFSTDTGARVAELRRGLDAAKIFSLRFSPSGAMLASTSDKGTLHLYDIPRTSSSGEPTGSGAGVGSVAKPGSTSGGTNTTTTTSGNKAAAHAPGIQTAADTPGLGFSGTDILGKPTSPMSGTAENGGNNLGNPMGTTAPSSSGTNTSPLGKWGILSQLPLMPRYFRDVTSFAQTTFASSDDAPVPGIFASLGDQLKEVAAAGDSRSPAAPNRPQHGHKPSLSKVPDAAAAAAKPTKGEIGWPEEDQLVVIGAGDDARWERFRIERGQGGERIIVRSGWRRFMTDI